MNPFITQPHHQNYYNSPIINNPPPTSSHSSNYQTYNPYSQYNTNYPYNAYSNTYNIPYGNPAYQGYVSCSGCYGQAASYNNNLYGYYSGGGNCGCGCQGHADCMDYGYGYGFNKERLTPKFPEKLGHSYVTSGQRVEDKLVINQPTTQSAPFQSQHRKTYVPYTRKYIQYKDYIQYIPVQRSQWQYKKVMKQIDFVPQQYYESSYQYLPREKVQHKVRYLPVEQQVVHVPEETINERQRQHQHVRQSALNSNIIHHSQFHISPKIPQPPHQYITPSLPRSAIPTNISLPNQQQSQHLKNTHMINNRIIDLERQRQQQRNTRPTIIHPAESTVQMVPDSWFRRQQHHGQQGGRVMVENRRYNFSQTGGVVIGSSFQSQSNMSQPTPTNPKQSQTNQAFIPSQPIQASQVLNSTINRQFLNNQQNQNITAKISQQQVFNDLSGNEMRQEYLRYDHESYDNVDEGFKKKQQFGENHFSEIRGNDELY